jgi:hypothetical protein
MLSAEDQAECLIHLPSFDIVFGHSETGGRSSTFPKLADGFFEKNLSLQEDIRTFQVLTLSQIYVL